ncbi:piggyBac transposable element-derived protein 4-like [Ooceraea biroi]|nr:piggyBac transposable element-derived protein 4-like [Ooceraea biroi]
MKVGDFESQTSSTDLRWIKWMDKRVFHFLSNYHDPSEQTTVERRQKDGSLLSVESPVMCADYNSHMGYVDQADRTLSTYKIDRRSRKWWFRIFWHFLDVVVNSLILFKTKGLKPSLSLKQFRLALVNELIGENLPAKKVGNVEVWTQTLISRKYPWKRGEVNLPTCPSILMTEGDVLSVVRRKNSAGLTGFARNAMFSYA